MTAEKVAACTISIYSVLADRGPRNEKLSRFPSDQAPAKNWGLLPVCMALSVVLSQQLGLTKERETSSWRWTTEISTKC